MPDTNTVGHREYQHKTKASRFVLQSGQAGVLWFLASLLIIPVLLVALVVTSLTGVPWMFLVVLAAAPIATLVLQGNLLRRYIGLSLARWLPISLVGLAVACILALVVEFGFFFLLAFDDSGYVHRDMVAAAMTGPFSAARYAVWPMLFGLVLGLICGTATGAGQAITMSGYVRPVPWILLTIGGWTFGCMFGSAALALDYVYDAAHLVPGELFAVCLTLPVVAPLILSSILTSFEVSLSAALAAANGRPDVPVMYN